MTKGPFQFIDAGVEVGRRDTVVCNKSCGQHLTLVQPRGPESKLDEVIETGIVDVPLLLDLGANDLGEWRRHLQRLQPMEIACVVPQSLSGLWS